MKAIICDGAGGPEVISLGTAPDPTPKAGEVLIAVKATAINGADALQRKGRQSSRGCFHPVAATGAEQLCECRDVPTTKGYEQCSAASTPTRSSSCKALKLQVPVSCWAWKQQARSWSWGTARTSSGWASA